MADPIPTRSATAPAALVRVVTPREPRQRVRALGALAARGAKATARGIVAVGRGTARGARAVGRGLRSAYRTSRDVIKRRVGKVWSARKARAEIGARTRANGGSALLRLGKAALAVIVGAAVAFGIDKAVRQYVTENKGYRMLINLGLSVGVWFIAPWAGASWGGFLKVLAVSHLVTGVIILGVEAVNQAAAAG